MDIKTLCKAYQAGEKFNYIFFWSHVERNGKEISKACFSQWYPIAFMVDGVNYASAEHFMMASKAKLFNDMDSLQDILVAKEPAKAKSLGRRVKNFDSQVWDRHCLEVVIKGNLAKFSQHPTLTAFLLATGNKVLVEASPVDRVWGIGLAEDVANVTNPLTWQGQNLLGFALMAVRDQLKIF